MDTIALFVYIIIQILFIPITIFSFALLTYKQVFVSKNIGVSATATDPITTRWMMHIFGIREDESSARLFKVLPNTSPAGMWLFLLPAYLRYKISGKNKGYPSVPKEGKETMINGAIARTIYFDRIINKSKDTVEQIVVMGAGFDTRCYSENIKPGIGLFELDQERTQELKKISLKKAGMDPSAVKFVSVDFSKNNWFEQLNNFRFNPHKKTLFIWEAVTLYLSESEVRDTLAVLKKNCIKGSILVADFYTKRVLPVKGVKSTKEIFNFGLDFSSDRENAIKTFLESEGLILGDCYFMGHKTKKGALAVISEVLI